jgi:hypothetical protein
MNSKRTEPKASIRGLPVILGGAMLALLSTLAGVTYSQATNPPPAAPQPSAEIPPPGDNDAAPDVAPAASPQQLDSLVAPIALYPDNLLAQVLAASTYPLEIVQLQQWLAKNPGLKDQALTDAVMKQPWDSSVQALAPMTDVIKRMADNISWTTDLGNAFLAQQSDVMDAIQRMRKKAKDGNKLATTEQQKVETQVVDNKSVIVIQQSNPEVVYVPSYDPVAVWGAPYYPYPPMYYPPYYPLAGAAITFGVGMAIGAAWGGCGWGHNEININNNNNYVRNQNSNRNVNNRSGNSNWQHNPAHRGGAPYQDRSTANRYGGTTRGDTLANRQNNARQDIGRQGSDFGNRGGAGGGDRGGGDRGGGGDFGGRGGGDRGGGGDFGGRGGGGDSIGGRDVSRGSGGSSAFDGGSRGFSGSNARSSSSRGSSSMGSRGGGGMRGGGGRRR